MKFEGIRTVSVGCFFGHILRKIDNFNRLERTLFHANVASYA